MNGKRLSLLAIALLALAAGVGYQYLRPRTHTAPNELRVSGNIEATDAEVSFKIPGRVEERLVDEGQSVQRDQPIARLDSSDLRAEVDLRRAELAAARAALAELEAGSRPEEIEQARAAKQQASATLDELVAGFRPQEIAVARATADAAKAELTRAESDYQRASQLIKGKAISVEDYDRMKAAFEVAGQRAREAQEQLNLRLEGTRQEKIAEARAALAQASARYDLVKAGPRQETKDQARARVQQAEAALKLAETRLGYADIVAPMSGMVLSKNIEPGEYVAPGTPVVTIGDLEHPWLRAYISETDLGRIKLGQPVQVTTDTYPGKVFEGHISFISDQAEFTPKNVQTEQQRVKLVYRIKIDLKNPEQELKPGMPADAVIALANGTESSGLAGK